MRAPVPSEPNYYTFPTYQVPQVSAMRGSAPPVQVARTARVVGADPPSESSCVLANAPSSVINGSSCPSGNSNLRMQSVTDNCLLNSVTVPKIQRNVAHNNKNNNISSDRLARKSGALLLLGQDIPSNQKADTILPELMITTTMQCMGDNAKDGDVVVVDPRCNTVACPTSPSSSSLPPATTPNTVVTTTINSNSNDKRNNITILTKDTKSTTTAAGACNIKSSSSSNINNMMMKKQSDTTSYYYPFEKLLQWSQMTRAMERAGVPTAAMPTMRLLGGGESSINTGTSGWGTPPSQQASNNNASTSSGWGTANPANQNNAGTQQWNNNANRTPTSAPGNANQDVKSTSNLSSNGQQSAPSQSSGAGWGPSNKQQQAAIGNGQPLPPNNPQQQQQQSNQQANIATSQQQQQQQVPPQPAISGGGGAGVGGVGAVGANVVGGPIANPSTKQQLEQLSNMREAIYSQDGWGGQYVNQDTNWDIPDSPEPAIKMDGGGGGGGGGGGANVPTLPWKPNVNNGTELWEVNLRNGGQPPPQPQQKTPWGHTPSTNIGGTWGEDDDVADSSNVWTGVPAGQQPQQAPPQQQQPQQWGASSSSVVGGGGGNIGTNSGANTGTAMWGGGGPTKKEIEWGAGSGNISSVGGGNGGIGGNQGGGGAWCDPRTGTVAPQLDPRDMCSGDPRDLRGVGAGGGGGGGVGGVGVGNSNNAGGDSSMRLVDPSQQMRILGAEMRGDPRGGITGRLNGSSSGAEFWGQGPGPQQSVGAHHMHHQGNKMPVGPGGGGGVGGGGGNGNAGGWEELSPPSQRRNMPSYDNGTSLWGNPQPGSHWKDLPTGAGGGGVAMGSRGGGGGGNVGGPPGMPPNNGRPGMKPPADLVGNSGAWRNGGSSWGGPCDDQGVGGGWSEEASPWNKQKCIGGGGGGGTPLWAENEMDWSHKQQGIGGGGGVGPKPPLTKEAVWGSKQFRLLVEMGYKKEDVENALRLRDMNYDEALDMLSTRLSNMDWRGSSRDDHYDGGPPFAGQRFPSGPTGPQLNYPPGNNMPNLGGSLMNPNPALVQKILAQTGGSQGIGGSGNNGGGGAGNAGGRSLSIPSTAQLRLLVHQIQMAVQAGYLNHQILNQPLAPQTLVLLNQLLQQIKNLQQLMSQQQMAQNQGIGKSNTAVLQYSVYITKTKQSINNLQNQIASQQANYVKQHHTPSDLFKTNPVPDSINALQCDIAEMGIKDNQSSQSRFIRDWKLPSNTEENSDFIRAVGKPVVPSHNSPNLNPLGLPQSAGPWSSGRSGGDTGWPDTGSGETPSDIKDAQWAVPEFEPGKPWKGTQKTIEDDPSITPGSVGRSPLSLSTIKDSDIFNQPSKSPPVSENSIQSISLSSSTWSYPTSSSSNAFASPQNKLPSNKSVLGALTPTTAAATDLWSAPKRGPPPGLSNKGGGVNSSVNGWIGNIAGGSSAGWRAPRNSWTVSQWLLLRNLTAQIDGSTLRTLCMQHGPLECFHLYLHNGYALAKYQSNEEAAKAKNALNNCVLGNTTILAENPSDWEATNLVQQVSKQPGGSGGGWRGSAAVNNQPQQNASENTWSTGWANTSASAATLWGSSTLDSAEQSRGTPSNLQQYLPPDLLGGESI